MRIFIIGGNGMAGHMIKNYFQSKPSNDLYYSIREPSENHGAITLDLMDEHSTFLLLQQIQPDIVINAAGILNDDTKKRLEESIYINSLLPHKLASYGPSVRFSINTH